MTEKRSPEDQQIREALARVLASERFQNAERIRQILQYVVDQCLDGKADAIRAKSIALDVYGYSVDEVAERETAVRVDAGRLRRRLQDYYAAEGRHDPVVIELPKGTYSPKFRVSASIEDDAGEPGQANGLKAETDAPGAARANRFGFGPWSIALVLALIVTAGVAVLMGQSPEQAKSEPTRAALERERIATYAASPARLLAINLADTGRDVIFPAVDPHRLRAALAIFEAAIEADPSYSGGYAGATQVRAIQALVALKDEDAEALLQSSQEALLEAERRGPEAAWTHSARASFEWANGHFPEALLASATALSLEPADRHVLEFHSLIALYAGDFKEVVETVSAAKRAERLPSNAVFNNALGAAHFHSGNIKESVATFEETVAAGGPAGPITLAYLAAGYHRLGAHDTAARKVKQLMDTWPEFPLEPLFERLFDDPAHAQQLTATLRDAGWRPPGS